MTELTFADCRVDLAAGTLTRGGSTVRLRPKAAALLELLIEGRGQVVTKKTISDALWPNVTVTGQSLFQVVSELRRALAPLQPIRTSPNLGYAWVLPVRRVRRRRWLPAAAAALAGAALSLSLLPHPSPAPVSASLSLPPALSALAEGLEALRAGRPDQAQPWFELAIRENPEFAEARLLLAETLLARGVVGDARSQALWLIDQTGASADPYLTVAAMDVMSRSDLRVGAGSTALQWIREAADQARALGFACAAAGLEERVVALMSPLEEGAAVPAPVLAKAPDYCDSLLPETDRPLRSEPAHAPDVPSSGACVPQPGRATSAV